MFFLQLPFKNVIVSFLPLDLLLFLIDTFNCLIQLVYFVLNHLFHFFTNQALVLPIRLLLLHLLVRLFRVLLVKEFLNHTGFRNFFCILLIRRGIFIRSVRNLFVIILNLLNGFLIPFFFTIRIKKFLFLFVLLSLLLFI